MGPYLVTGSTVFSSPGIVASRVKPTARRRKGLPIQVLLTVVWSSAGISTNVPRGLMLKPSWIRKGVRDPVGHSGLLDIV